MRESSMSRYSRLTCVFWFVACFATVLLSIASMGQERVPPASTATASQTQYDKTTKDYNDRLLELDRMLADSSASASPADYRIGADDLLKISVFEAPEMNHEVRVSAGGTISLPLLGDIRAQGLSPIELESVIDALLRRTYMKDPHVSVFVSEMQSHSVAVFGAVKKPGVFQIRGAKTLVEVLSMAEGLSEDAGDSVVIVRRNSAGAESLATTERTSSPAENDPSPGGGTASHLVKIADRMSQRADSPANSQSTTVDLKNLLESGDPSANVLVYPGDVVKVERAGVVYVVGEVKKPGGFELRDNEAISVVQAIALAEGLTRTSATSRAQLIHTDPATGARTEAPIDLKKILAGHAPDPMLRARDIVFVPNSGGRSALYRGLEAAIAMASGIAVYRI